MIVENGKIVKCTDQELYTHWLRTLSEFMDYEDYKRRCIELGTEVVDER